MDNSFIERLAITEKTIKWLEDRIWREPGNHHERIHKLEDSNGDRIHEIELIKGDVDKIERVLGLNGYGSKNMLSDLRDAINTIGKIKSGIISTSEFQALLRDVDGIKSRLVTLEKYNSEESGNRNLVKSTIINTIVTALVLWMLKAMGIV